MKYFEYVVTDPIGLHARPAGLLVEEAKRYRSVVTINKGSKKADAKKLMMLMSLGIKSGERIVVEIDGEDEETACEGLKVFFTANL